MLLLSFCLIFCQSQPGVAYKSVAYKKRVFGRGCVNAPLPHECLETEKGMLTFNSKLPIRYLPNQSQQ